MKRLVVVLGALLALGAGVARGGGTAAPGPLPCGLPQTQPLWVDYADGMVPFWSTIFARPGIVAAASQFIVPPQLRAKGAKTVFFDLYLNNRVGTPSKPADPGVIQARADKLFDTAVTSSGCDQPLIAENELFGAQLPTPWTATTAQYRANVLAYLQRLAARGARPFLLLSNRPYTHDPDADAWWQAASQVADIVPEVYFSGPQISKQGAVAGSRRLRATIRTRMEDLIQIGVPTNRLGMMLTFSSTPKAGGREGLQLSKWLDVVKWEEIAAAQVAAELHLASIWSWGWAAFNPAGNDPDKPKAACVWLWTRDHSLCDAPALAGKDFDPSLDVGDTLPAGTLCLLGSTRLLASDVSALNRLTGNRDLAFSAELQHAVLVQAASRRRQGRGPGGGRHDSRSLRRQPVCVPGGAGAGEGDAGARTPDPRRRAAPSGGRVAPARSCAGPGDAPRMVRDVCGDARPPGAGRPSRAVARQPAQRGGRVGRGAGAAARARGRGDA